MLAFLQPTTDDKETKKTDESFDSGSIISVVGETTVEIIELF